ncbi:MAG TPA: HemK family protein methyltransferase, partial [Fibrobacteraceae bacterium]|nr:HemK family protein methyltransferase [Fibrobacteraceae bacterium]
AIAMANPDAQLEAIDLSQEALDLARENIIAHKLESRIRLHQGDLLSAWDGPQPQLIVSNPPYIPQPSLLHLQAEVQQDPMQALDGGPDGLDVARRLIVQSERILAPEGVLLMELGEKQPAQLRMEFPQFTIKEHADLSGVRRFAECRKTEAPSSGTEAAMV